MIERFSNVALELGQLILFGKSSKQRLNQNLIFWFSILFKLAISGGAIYYIIIRLFEYETNLSVSEFLVNQFSPAQFLWFAAIAITLMAANWGVEILKWHHLLSNEFNTRFRTAIKGVLSGTTFGVFTPNRTGEFIGRVLAVQGKNRVGATVLSFVNSLSQTLATLSFGIIGLVYLIEVLALEDIGLIASRLTQMILIAFWAIMVMLYFKIGRLHALTSGNRIFGKLAKHLNVLTEVSVSSLNRLFLLSIFRFLTFIAQYLLVFGLLYPEANFIQIGSLAILTMFSTMVFSMLPVPDLLMREAMALSYFGLFNFDLILVSKAVFLVWCFNVAIPALIGAIVLLTHRIFRSA
ncbi:MAG: lysylphosphatidylglycerol synthase domain-containing protein [Flavobacteriales bacterium]